MVNRWQRGWQHSTYKLYAQTAERPPVAISSLLYVYLAQPNAFESAGMWECKLAINCDPTCIVPHETNRQTSPLIPDVAHCFVNYQTPTVKLGMVIKGEM
jgi:hypothetical protein